MACLFAGSLIAACAVAPDGPGDNGDALAAAPLVQADTLVGVHTAGDAPELVTEMLRGRHGYTTELAYANGGGVHLHPNTVGALVGAGLSVILRIDYGDHHNIPYDATSRADFVASISAMGRSYYDSLAAVVVGNEPNFHGECQGFGEDEEVVSDRWRCSVSDYVDAYLAARQAIRGLGSSVPVVVAGLSPGGAFTIRTTACHANELCECDDEGCTFYVRFASDLDYYRDLMQTFAQRGVAPDAVAVHAYGGFGGGTTPLAEAQASFDAQAQRVRLYFPGMPLYLTELAAHTCFGSCTAEQQPAADAAAAEFVRGIYPWLAGYGGVRAATWFIFADVGNNWPTRIRWVQDGQWHTRGALYDAFGDATTGGVAAPATPATPTGPAGADGCIRLIGGEGSTCAAGCRDDVAVSDTLCDSGRLLSCECDEDRPVWYSCGAC